MRKAFAFVHPAKRFHSFLFARRQNTVGFYKERRTDGPRNKDTVLDVVD